MSEKCDGKLENCGAMTSQQYIDGNCPQCEGADDMDDLMVAYLNGKAAGKRESAARVRELEDAIREVESLPRNHRDTVDLEQIDDWIRKVLGMVG